MAAYAKHKVHEQRGAAVGSGSTDRNRRTFNRADVSDIATVQHCTPRISKEDWRRQLFKYKFSTDLSEFTFLGSLWGTHSFDLVFLKGSYFKVCLNTILTCYMYVQRGCWNLSTCPCSSLLGKLVVWSWRMKIPPVINGTDYLVTDSQFDLKTPAMIKIPK